jgi:hypothetical protein
MTKEEYNTSILNLLVTGDNMLGASNSSSNEELLHRRDELKVKKEALSSELQKKENMIATNNRDFIDQYQSKPPSVFTIEDYSVLIFLLAYLFMVGIFIYLYTINADTPMNGLGKSILISVIVSIVGGIIFYSVA